MFVFSMHLSHFQPFERLNALNFLQTLYSFFFFFFKAIMFIPTRFSFVEYFYILKLKNGYLSFCFSTKMAHLSFLFLTANDFCPLFLFV